MRLYLMAILMIFGLLLCSQAQAQTPTIERNHIGLGDFGEDVMEAQLTLVELGYTDLDTTGLFGHDTMEAVASFQERAGIDVTGIIDDLTKERMIVKELTTATQNGALIEVTENDILVLAKIIHGEARGEPYVGQVAVGAVVVNRVKNPLFPNNVSGVVFEPLAFTAVADGQYYMSPNRESFRAAYDALKGVDPSDGALYYYNPAKATSRWIYTRPVIKRIGKHTFAR